MSLRTARRADRRLREAAIQAATLTDAGTDASAARLDLACLAIKAATAEQLGVRGLRRLSGGSAMRAQPLGERLRFHAEKADAAIERAEAALTEGARDPAPTGTMTGPEGVAGPGRFQELHASELHGFALLLTLGDRPAAAELASAALAAGAARARELEHPRRAATWLRHAVVRAATGRSIDGGVGEATRRAALDALEVDDTAFAALSALSTLERAAVVASTVEGLQDHDVAMVTGLDPARAAHLVRDALLRAVSSPAAESARAEPHGSIVERTREVAARVLA